MHIGDFLPKKTDLNPSFFGDVGLREEYHMCSKM